MTDWLHSPPHHFTEGGMYFITAGTYLKRHHFRATAALDALRDSLFVQAKKNDCWLQAWALFSNHYHLVVHCEDAGRIRRMLVRLHIDTAIDINRRATRKGARSGFNTGTRNSPTKRRGSRD
jgi:putative transposase